MARKPRRVCVIPHWWTEEQKANSSCGDGSHKHVTQADANLGVSMKDYVWLIEERIVREMRIRANIRDLSAKVGSYLAKRIRQKADWALTMQAQMQCRREAPQDSVF